MLITIFGEQVQVQFDLLPINETPKSVVPRTTYARLLTFYFASLLYVLQRMYYSCTLHALVQLAMQYLPFYRAQTKILIDIICACITISFYYSVLLASASFTNYTNNQLCQNMGFSTKYSRVRDIA